MEENKKKKSGLIVCIIMIVILVIVVALLSVNSVLLKQKLEKNEADLINFNKTKVENKIDTNTVVENVLVNENTTSNSTSNGTSDVTENLGKELNSDELSKYTEMLNKADYNPFIVQRYTDIDKISVFNIFYDGAGDPSSKESSTVSEFKEVIGEPMNSNNIVKVRVSYIEDLLKRRIGKVPANWRDEFRASDYSDKYQAYYRENMDTQYQEIEVIKGFERDNKYILMYKSAYINNRIGIVAMVKQDNGEYKFLSNNYVYYDV